MKNFTPPKRVLFLALSGIGNYLMQSPTIAALKKAHPDWQITVWVAPRGTKVLAENDPNVDEVFEAPIRNGFLGHWQTIQTLRRPKFDIGIVLSPGQLLKSAVYLWLAGIPRRIGHTYPHGLLLTDAIPEDPAVHDIEQNLKLLGPLGFENWNLKIEDYELVIPEHFKQQASNVMQKLSIPADVQLIGIHAGSAPGFGFKRWPLENFARVAKELIAKRGAQILIFGGPDEQEMKEHLLQLVGQSTTFINADLFTSAAVMQRCSLFLSNDSGLMHLAAAVGVPTFGLFGPTDERQTGPRSQKSYVIRAPGTKPVYHTEKNFDVGQAAYATMVAITPALVLDTILRAGGQ